MLTKKFSFLNNPTFIYGVLVAFVILDRIFIYTHFNHKFVGNDDLIFWQGATDYMKGDFYAPYFYGQNYNVMLESFFAIPFLKLGLSYKLAFFIATSSIALFPFFLFSIVLFKKQYVPEAFFFLVIPLLLPVEYGIITSISRGFVNGLFFTGFFVFPLLYPEKKSSWIIAALAASIGHVVNPNLIIVSFPLYLYLLFVNFKKIYFYLCTAIAIIPALIWEIIAKDFYVQNPEYNFNPLIELKFKTPLFLKSFHELGTYFSYLTPLVWPAGWLILILILLSGIFLLKKELKKGVAIILGLLFIVLTLGINKVHSVMDTIFLSGSRMYLGIPILTGIIFFWCRSLFAKITDKQLQQSILGIVICTFIIKLFFYTAVVDQHTAKTIYGGVAIKKLDDLKCECDSIKKISDAHQVDLVVSVATWDYGSLASREFIAYGCPLLEKKFPTTVLTPFEKRSWVILEERPWTRTTILFYGNLKDTSKLKTIGNCEIISNDSSKIIFIIKNNELRLDSLFNKVAVQQ